MLYAERRGGRALHLGPWVFCVLSYFVSVITQKSDGYCSELPEDVHEAPRAQSEDKGFDQTVLVDR